MAIDTDRAIGARIAGTVVDVRSTRVASVAYLKHIVAQKFTESSNDFIIWIKCMFADTHLAGRQSFADRSLTLTWLTDSYSLIAR